MAQSFVSLQKFWIPVVLGLSLGAACSAPPVAPHYEKANSQGTGDSTQDPGESDNPDTIDDNGEGTGDPIDPPVDDGMGGDDPIDDMTPDPMEPEVPEEPKPIDPLSLPSYTQDPGDQATITNNKNDAEDSRAKYSAQIFDAVDKRKFEHRSQDSQIYKGNDAWLTNKTNITWTGNVYLPPNYKKGTEIPFMLVGDGEWGQHIKLLPQTIENMIAKKQIPPMAAIFIRAGGGDGPGSQRSLEYDTMSARYSDFIESEILPLVEKKFDVKLTRDPNGRGTLGGSSSGAMAFTAAWYTPDRYRRVISYSGTFVDRAVDKNGAKAPGEEADGAWAYHNAKNLIGNAERKPLRIWMQVSENDNNFKPDVKNNWMQANRDMAKVLWEKGYPRKFYFSNGAGHVDSNVYKSTLPKAMEWVWKGYVAPE